MDQVIVLVVLTGSVDLCAISLCLGVAQEVQNLTEMPQGAQDVRRHLIQHLQKDIELLAKVLGKSQQDAELTVHLFLKFILESSSGKISSRSRLQKYP